MEALSLALAEALPLEIERVKEIVKIYRQPELKGAGEIAARLMEVDIKKAEMATIEQDTVEMLRSYYILKEYTT